MNEQLAKQYRAVLAEIAATATACGRDPAGVRLLAVSKFRTAEEVRALAVLGQVDFGENYVQEALLKQQALGDLALVWHLIGPLQSNKTAEVAAHFDWVHALDRLRIAERLSRQRPAHLPPLNVCLQVNTSGESSKSGVDPAELLELALGVTALPGLSLRGLMCLPEPVEGFEAQRREFQQLATLADVLRGQGLRLDTLSMGTTADLAAAVTEGASWVRVGTGIFGPRPGPAAHQ